MELRKFQMTARVCAVDVGYGQLAWKLRSDARVTVLERTNFRHLDPAALPFRPPQIHVQQYWHRRMQDDAANRWLRGVFYEVNRRDAGASLPE